MTLKGETKPMSDLLPLAKKNGHSGSKKRSRPRQKKKENAMANAEKNTTQDNIADPLEKILKRKKIG